MYSVLCTLYHYITLCQQLLFQVVSLGPGAACYLWYIQGTHCTGKTGKMASKIPCQGKHREFGNFAKTQGIWFAQVVKSLILNYKR